MNQNSKKKKDCIEKNSRKNSLEIIKKRTTNIYESISKIPRSKNYFRKGNSQGSQISIEKENGKQKTDKKMFSVNFLIELLDYTKN